MPAHPNDILDAIINVHARKVDDAPYTDAEDILIGTPFPKGPCRAIYVGGATPGDVHAVMWPSGDQVVFSDVPIGTTLRICATDTVTVTTTASKMLALY